MDFLVWGAGAIGGTLGAYLARSGHTVQFVDQVAEHVEAIHQAGLKITGPIDEFTVQVPAFTPPQLSGQFTTILLCTKAQHTRQATEMLLSYLADDGCVVSVQNGFNELEIAEIVGAERTVGAFVNFGADYLEPGVIHFGGRGAVVLGEIDGQITPRIEALHRAFLDFDANAIVTSNIWGYLWGKEAYGAMLFVTALTNDSIADALAEPTYRDLYRAIATEILAVALAKGIQPESFNGFNPNAFLPGTDPAITEQSMDEMVAFNRRSAKTHSGIWRDLAVRKRRTEINMFDQVVHEGQRLGVPTPLTARMIALIHEIEDGQRPLDRANLDDLKAVLHAH
ncbi:MAG: ketopantoate reductase family protein [Anaerolineae bacterium]|nr:ketopantoate reductase family protein [Anaerolineae bacterium]